jgi:hypothetical protein
VRRSLEAGVSPFNVLEILKETQRCHFSEYGDEQEYIVGSTLLSSFEIVECY